MKRGKEWLTILAGFSLIGCGQGGSNPFGEVGVLVLNSLGEDLALVTRETPPVVLKGIVKAGTAPNQVLARGSEILVLNSGSDSLQVLEPETWTVVREYTLGKGCNPYLMALTPEGQLLVTCLLSNELILVEPDAAPAANAVLKRLAMPTGADLKPFDAAKPGLAQPQGIAVAGNKAYVTLTNLGTDYSPAGPGLVLVVDLVAWLKTKILQLGKTNPGYAYPVSGGGGSPRVYVTCSGSFDGTGTVEILETLTDTVSAAIAIGGAPGRMWVDEQGTGWVGDQLEGQLLPFEIETGRVLTPVVLCPSDPSQQIFNFVSDVADDGQGSLWAACFATDQLMKVPQDQPSDPPVVLEVGDGPISLWVP